MHPDLDSPSTFLFVDYFKTQAVALIRECAVNEAGVVVVKCPHWTSLKIYIYVLGRKTK